MLLCKHLCVSNETQNEILKRLSSASLSNLLAQPESLSLKLNTMSCCCAQCNQKAYTQSCFAQRWCCTRFCLSLVCSLLYNKGTLDTSRKLSQTGELTQYDECLQLFQSAHLATARLPPGFKYSDPYVGGLCLSSRLGSISPICTFTDDPETTMQCLVQGQGISCPK